MKAFPILNYQNGENAFIYENKGMDLRDYFAAKAMQTMLSWKDVGSFNVSAEAYMMADAMMEARKQ